MAPTTGVALTPFQLVVHNLVRTIPAGKVATYGEVARAAGSPGGARAVGGTMRNNPYAPGSGCGAELETP